MDNSEIAAALVSIADSLKRIADALEDKSGPAIRTAEAVERANRMRASDRSHGR